MRFVDQCKVKVVAGAGGNGAVAFRREKYIPFGGPSGGDGGRGGDVVFVGDEGMTTLLDFTHQRTLEAKRGGHGLGSDCHGRGAEDREERVPVGTQIHDALTGELLADVTTQGQRFIVARGGKGGRGNIHFATSIDRAPRRAEKGDPGEIRELELTLKVMADVGLLGFPNVGKSTFVASVSHARPKIADYPFTTLAPTLGVVEIGGGARSGGTSFVIADIPGLIPGASEGVGLGIRFLQHVERTRVLLHLVTLDATEGREPLADYFALRKELEKFSPELAERPEIIVLSKTDIPEVREAYPELKKRFAAAGVKLRMVSAATRDGLDELVNDLYRRSRPGFLDEDDVPTRRIPPKPAAEPAPAPAKQTARAKPAAGPASAKKQKRLQAALEKANARKAPKKRAVAQPVKKKAAAKTTAKTAKTAKTTAKTAKTTAKRVIKPSAKTTGPRKAAKKKPSARIVAKRPVAARKAAKKNGPTRKAAPNKKPAGRKTLKKRR